MAENGQYRPGQAPFGMGAIADTGAPGSVGISADESAPLLATVPIRSAYASAQAPADNVVVSVGDTLGMSSDASVPRASGDPLTGLSLADVTTTGAGMGRVGGPGNPNSMNAPLLAAQLSLARRLS